MTHIHEDFMVCLGLYVAFLSFESLSFDNGFVVVFNFLCVGWKSIGLGPTKSYVRLINGKKKWPIIQWKRLNSGGGGSLWHQKSGGGSIIVIPPLSSSPSIQRPMLIQWNLRKVRGVYLDLCTEREGLLSRSHPSQNLTLSRKSVGILSCDGLGSMSCKLGS